MVKKPMSWIDVVTKQIDVARKNGRKAGVRDVLPEAKKEWQKIKSGTHPDYVLGKARGTKKRYRKGSKSKSRKGRLDFVTHKGDKYYNRKGHRQTKSRSGRKGRPYRRMKRGG